MLRFAANLSMLFPDRPMLERVAAAAAAGFDGVEVQFPYAAPPEDWAEALAASRTPIALHNLPAGDWAAGERGIACLPGREEEFRDGLETAIRYARALGCPLLNCLSGIAPAEADPAALDATFRQNLTYAAERLEREGIGLVIEAINTRDVPGFFLNRSAQAFDVIRKVGAPNLRFQYDVYHMQVMEGDLAPTLAAHLPMIGHIQIADTPGRHEPGTGEINYPFLFRHLARIGYRGWIGAEYLPAGDTEAGLGWLRAAKALD